MEQGCVFNIQRYTIHDGPGIRTEVFLKGCPLSCPWCSNPESHSLHPEPGIYPNRCLGRKACGLCERAVQEAGVARGFARAPQEADAAQGPERAVLRGVGGVSAGHPNSPHAVCFDEEGVVCSIRRDVEAEWRACVRACPTDALKTWGEVLDVDQVMEVVEKDRRYYETSGGGITISGGEPLVQADFAAAILRRCRQAGIHTCLESTLYASWEALEPVLDLSDLLICDVKCIDAEKHARFTGVGNEAILDNLARATRKTDQVIVRVPVIPGFNDTLEDARAIGQFLVDGLQGAIREVQLLEFMHLGEEKCRSLERPYPLHDQEVNREELHATVLAMQDHLRERALNCVLGGGLKK